MTGYFSYHRRAVEIFFIIFYSIGFFGLATPFSHNTFIKLFPVALILSFTAILLYHQHSYNTRIIAVLTIIGLAGYFIEVAGISTHIVFGNYSYGNALGIKVLNTPILIGINWIMLSYAGSSIVDPFPLSAYLKIIIASLLMLLYDIILELIAADLDMWYWDSDIVPLRNYIAWFGMAMIFQTFIKIMKIKTRNSIALMIVFVQIIFFISLFLFFKLSE